MSLIDFLVQVNLKNALR